jgi:1-acyl-sn-glycerol-3-phosphate acyltransferase
MTTEVASQTEPRAAATGREIKRDRSRTLMVWYRIVQHVTTLLFSIQGGIRASGRQHLPKAGGVILVSNHLSHFDVFVLGIPLPRPLNYVARSSLFFPPLGFLIRTVGGFPIQRDGMGAQGLKETLRRLRNGGIVTLFPEGTRSRDGSLGSFKQGISTLAARAHVPILPAAVAGTFEAWPRGQALPSSHPIWIHYGEPILPEQLEDRSPEEVTDLIRERIRECQIVAQQSVARLRSAKELG